MPILRNWDYSGIPKWCQLKKYEKLELLAEKPVMLSESYPKVTVRVLSGKVRIQDGNAEIEMTPWQSYASDNPNLILTHIAVWFIETSEVVVLYGDWKEDHKEAGMFVVSPAKYKEPHNIGSKLDCIRNTLFDCHYHDFDEYWLLVEGSGIVYNEGKFFEVHPGDCVITGMGYEHDFPIVYSRVTSVSLHTDMMGQKRIGHLWRHTDGPAIPDSDREAGSIDIGSKSL